MTILTRLGVAFLLVAAALPFVVADDCKQGEFWFEDKNCCLPYGGQYSAPPPPPDKKCPHNDWDWNDDKSCCTPHYPTPPPPKCDNDWDWDDNEYCCKKRHPQPSGGVYKRSVPAKRDYTQLCPMGLTACPVTSLSGPTSDFECLDTTNELESCGGCASVGKGQDCTAIEGAWNVGCENGTCAVYTCATGYKRAHNGKSCIPS